MVQRDHCTTEYASAPCPVQISLADRAAGLQVVRQDPCVTENASSSSPIQVGLADCAAGLQVVRRDPSTSAATLLYHCSINRGLTFSDACALLHSLAASSPPAAAVPTVLPSADGAGQVVATAGADSAALPGNPSDPSAPHAFPNGEELSWDLACVPILTIRTSSHASLTGWGWLFKLSGVIVANTWKRQKASAALPSTHGLAMCRPSIEL